MRSIIFVLIWFFTACSSHNYKRVALVIGNQNYRPLKDKLSNPINDSIAIGKKLHSVGYKVFYEKDLNEDGMDRALEVLKKAIIPNDTILFIYYAGHAMIPIKNSIDTQLSLISYPKKKFYSIFKVYDKLRELKASHNIIAIDACQNYKGNYKSSNLSRGYQHKFRASEYDFTEEKDDNKLPSSIIISRATETNFKADDKSIYDKNHSPYARCMLKYLDRDDFIVENMFTAIRKCVIKETNGRQISNEYNHLTGSVYIPIRKGSSSIGNAY